jgi:hypothetical protein
MFHNFFIISIFSTCVQSQLCVIYDPHIEIKIILICSAKSELWKWEI